MREQKRPQYARNYLELFDLFERNGIDVWTTMEDIVDATDEANIEWDRQYDRNGGMFRSTLVDALRRADRDGEDRMQAVIALEKELRGEQ